MFDQPPAGRNYSRTFAIRDLEYDREMAAERRKAAQRRRQALLEARAEDYQEAYL